jgi:hypothetical protein
MCAYIQQVERPSLFRCRFLAPGSKIALLAVVLAMASLVSWGGVFTAPALIDRVMVLNLLASGYWLLA